MVLADLGLFLLSSIALVVFGAILVRTMLRVAQFLRLSEFLVAFFIMSIATSLPELFIGIRSAMAGNPSLALGNVIGSMIADLSLVAGIVILLARKVEIKEKQLKRDLWLMVLIAVLPLILMAIGGELSRFDGIILLACYVGYLTWLYIERHDHKTVGDHVSKLEAVLDVMLFCGAGVALFFSAEGVVLASTKLAISLDLPSILIGLIFVAIGTSLPELVFGTRAVLARHPQLAIGDLVGATVVNALLVLGVTAVITPITTSIVLFFTSAVFLVFLLVMFATMASRHQGFSWEEGVVLILFYVLFLIIELNVKEFFIK
jgi:cation:H+ antiporter